MKLHKIAFILLVIGGINWLLAAFNYDLGHWGVPSSVLMVVYILIGASAIFEIVGHGKNCRTCNAGNMGGQSM